MQKPWRTVQAMIRMIPEIDLRAAYPIAGALGYYANSQGGKRPAKTPSGDPPLSEKELFVTQEFFGVVYGPLDVERKPVQTFAFDKTVLNGIVEARAAGLLSDTHVGAISLIWEPILATLGLN